MLGTYIANAVFESWERTKDRNKAVRIKPFFRQDIKADGFEWMYEGGAG